jgi:hypothetical protein
VVDGEVGSRNTQFVGATPEALITLHSICKGYGASRPLEEPMMSGRLVATVIISTPRTVMLLIEVGSVDRGR